MSDYNNDPYRAPAQSGEQTRHRRSDRHRAPQNEKESAGDATRVYQQPRRDAAEPEIQWARRQPAMPSQDSEGGTAPYRYGGAEQAYVPRTAPVQPDEEDEYEERPFPWLKIILIGAAVLAILAVALMAILGMGPFGVKDSQPDAGQPAPTQLQQPLADPDEQGKAEAYSFQPETAAGTVGESLAFTVVTSPAVQDVAVSDDDDNFIASSSTVALNASGNRVWTVRVTFEEPFAGRVYAVIETEGETRRTELSALVTVTEPEPEPTETPAPTQAPLPTQKPVSTAAAPAGRTATAAPTADVTVAPVATWAPTNAPLPTEAPTVAPTDAPEAVQETPEPVPTPDPTAAPTQAPTPVPTQTPLPQMEASAGAGSLKVTDTVYQGGKSVNFTRKNSYQAPHPDMYSRHDIGVFTFRGDNFRRNAAFGTVDVQKEQMTVLWQTPIGSLRTKSSTLYGVGWTGQPAIIKWTIQARSMMNMYEEKKNTSALREVIFGAQDGKIYFLDIRDGSATRDPINVGYPLKGSVAVNALGMPLIAVGQGISQMPDGKQHPIGLHLYYLTDGKEAYFLNGRQSKTQIQYITNGAFDGTALFLYNDSTRGASGDAMIVAGENGLLYTVDLNSKWSYPTDEEPDKETSFSISPDVTYLRTKANTEKEANVGVESSVAMYDKYIYMADAYGIIRCVDSDTMRTVWAIDGGDNIDAALALDVDGDSVSLYTGNTAYSRLGSKQDVSIYRLNALTGEVIWRYGIKCDKSNDQLSGCKASPVIGEHGIGDLVIFTVNMVQGGGSRIVALEKATGQVRWEYSLKATAISSPIAVYNDAGDAWIIQADESGVLTMLNGKTGSFRSSLDLGGTIQGSPAAYKNYLVIGTCDKDNSYMYGIRIE